jgi:hypothetical protein
MASAGFSCGAGVSSTGAQTTDLATDFQQFPVVTSGVVFSLSAHVYVIDLEKETD